MYVFYYYMAGDYSLRIDLEDFEGSHRFALYKQLKVESEEVAPVFCFLKG